MLHTWHAHEAFKVVKWLRARSFVQVFIEYEFKLDANFKKAGKTIGIRQDVEKQVNDLQDDLNQQQSRQLEVVMRVNMNLLTKLLVVSANVLPFGVFSVMPDD